VAMPRSYTIHPGIGIARVGDSPDDYFVGPEAPGCLASPAKADSPQAAGRSIPHFRNHDR
jgi:L-Lysine epsilon oxidase N-terminal